MWLKRHSDRSTVYTNHTTHSAPINPNAATPPNPHPNSDFATTTDSYDSSDRDPNSHWNPMANINLYPDSTTHFHLDIHPYTSSHCNGETYPHPYTNEDSDPHSDPNTHTDSNANGKTNRDAVQKDRFKSICAGHAHTPHS